MRPPVDDPDGDEASIASPSDSGVSRSDEKPELELRKLRAETNKTEHDARWVRRAELLRVVGAVLPALTILISVIGLWITINTQSKQHARNDYYHREDQFNAAVREFGSTSETAQLAAIAALDRFWRDSVFRDRVQDLLLASISGIRSPEARKLIQQQFVTYAEEEVLSKLADHNRATIAYIREMYPQHAVGFLPSDWPHSEQDSLLVSAYDQLGWNIATLIVSLNTAKRVHGINLGGVLFSRLRLVSQDTNAVWVRIDHAEFAEGLVFDSVVFAGAFMPGMDIGQARFHDVTLDSATLSGTLFSQTTFDGSSSLAGFITGPLAGLPVRAPAGFGGMRGGTTWILSSLEVDAFYPTPTIINEPAARTDYVVFFATSWIIKRPMPEWYNDLSGENFPLTGKTGRWTSMPHPHVLVPSKS